MTIPGGPVRGDPRDLRRQRRVGWLLIAGSAIVMAAWLVFFEGSRNVVIVRIRNDAGQDVTVQSVHLARRRISGGAKIVDAGALRLGRFSTHTDRPTIAVIVQREGAPAPDSYTFQASLGPYQRHCEVTLSISAHGYAERQHCKSGME